MNNPSLKPSFANRFRSNIEKIYTASYVVSSVCINSWLVLFTISGLNYNDQTKNTVFNIEFSIFLFILLLGALHILIAVICLFYLISQKKWRASIVLIAQNVILFFFGFVAFFIAFMAFWGGIYAMPY